MKYIPYVQVNLLEIPEPGKSVINVRLTTDDHHRVAEAAAIIGMNQSQFCRTSLVRAADKILEEAGVIK
jgi:uncharacterized protein (DUF1778 family)